MAHAGQEIHGQDGFRLLLVKTAAETDGELLEMEASYSGSGQLPPEHAHPSQVERFEVLEGSMRTIIDGSEQVYGAGETFEVPVDAPHQMAGKGPARVRWQVRPALRTADFFERLHGAAGDGPAILALLAEFSDEIRLTGA